MCLFFDAKKPSLSLLVRQPNFFELIIKESLCAIY